MNEKNKSIARWSTNVLHSFSFLSSSHSLVLPSFNSGSNDDDHRLKFPLSCFFFSFRSYNSTHGIKSSLHSQRKKNVIKNTAHTHTLIHLPKKTHQCAHINDDDSNNNNLNNKRKTQEKSQLIIPEWKE